MALKSTLRGLFGRRDPLDDIPMNPASASEIMDPASGLSSSTFGSDSILSVPAQGGPAGGAATRPAALDEVIDDSVALPLLGRRSTDSHQRLLVGGLTAMLVLTGLLLTYQWYAATSGGPGAAAAVQPALLGTQRVVQQAASAVAGEAQAFAALGAVEQGLRRDLQSLAALDPGLAEPAQRLEATVGVVLAQQAALVRLPAQLAEVRQRSGAQSDAADALLGQLIQNTAPASDVALGAQLARLLQRVRLAAATFALPAGASAPALVALGQDINDIQERIDQLAASARRSPF